MNTDDLTAQQIQYKLKSKVFELVTNEKDNNAIWKNDISLIGKKDENDIIQLLEGWAACNQCYMAYRTHSKSGIDGKRKNFGLNGIHDHLKHCKWKSKVKSTDNQGQNNQTTTSVIQPKFAFHKKGLPQKYKSKLKDAELKFIVGGSHSFNSLENNGLLNLVQTSIEIGANIGLVDVHDIFYGRQTIREEALSKFEQYTDQVRSSLQEPIKQHCVAATADLWTDDLMKRTYLDFTIFFVNDIYELKHTLLRCKHFEEEKSGINICLYQSYDTLLALLRQRGEQHRLLHISPQLLSEITEIAKELVDKYWTSTTQLHWIATYLDPLFKDSFFVTEPLILEKQKKLIKEGIHILANDYKNAILPTPSLSISHETISPPTKKKKEDLM
ncbi:unnamed protein product [Rotaria sordida]|uniref:Transposase n=1 Tax=Rotaria sordida TaxID=392033 RepID=A0A815EMQ5_9BILA|nr:unnamed protein product [Rotaria sordida]CAF1394944.1 unnamed protein product [Rotaria sordida]CAF1581882.1 unnamed protein product [Rotaria sordida]CAF3900074.1 unnamed protein product [Rotaria sordida]